MQTSIDAFNSRMARVHALHSLYKSLSVRLTAAVDLSDILRSEIVMAVSAFDYYIHELSRLGILECHKGLRPQTEAYKKLPMPISMLSDMADPAQAEQTLDALVRGRHGWLSFQRPDSIADAIRMFSNVKLWDAVGGQCDETPAAAKNAFQLIIDRRNQIAHEADVDPVVSRPTMAD